jgi:predicted transcriptional regulator
MLEPLLNSEKKEKILLYLYTHGESYAREIARAFQFNLNSVQNQLLNLENGGILYSKHKGKVRLFGMNPRYPFKKELEALLDKVLTFVPEKEKETFYKPRLRPRRTGKEL